MTEETRILKLIEVDPDDGTETPWGEVELAPDGILSVASADSFYEEYAQKFVDSINEKDRINVKVPGEKKFSIQIKSYLKSEPDFLQGLREYAQHYYSLKLLSDEDTEETAEEFEDLS